MAMCREALPARLHFLRHVMNVEHHPKHPSKGAMNEERQAVCEHPLCGTGWLVLGRQLGLT